MDTLLQGTLSRQNVLLTSLQGFRRSRFLLRNELNLLAKQRPEPSFVKIIHVCDKDHTLNRLYHEAQQLPLNEFGIKVAKYYNNESDTNKSDPRDAQASVKLILCTLKHLVNSDEQLGTLSTSNSVIVFDGLTLENIEGTCCEVQEQKYPRDIPTLKIFLPKLEFSRLSSDCWSIILACNPPVDGLQAELGCKFPIVLADTSISKPSYKTFASILTEGPNSVPFKFNTSDKDPRLHDEVGHILENCANQIESGGILVFFPSYGRMVEYHNAWQKSGLWERLNLPYGRENRAGDLFKNGLIRLAKEPKSIFMFSIRYHQDEILAEFALSLARAVLVVGLPYPFINDTWDARMQYNDETFLNSANGRLSGNQMYKYRAIEFMNGVLKRCLNEFRYRDCGFFLIDHGLNGERDKIARELGDVQEEQVAASLDRFKSHNNRSSL